MRALSLSPLLACSVQKLNRERSETRAAWTIIHRIDHFGAGTGRMRDEVVTQSQVDPKPKLERASAGGPAVGRSSELDPSKFYSFGL